MFYLLFYFIIDALIIVDIGLFVYIDDDCFYNHSWRNNVVIAFGTLSCMYMYICISVYMYAYTCIYARVWVYICTRVGAFCLLVLSNLSTTCACITGVS